MQHEALEPGEPWRPLRWPAATLLLLAACGRTAPPPGVILVSLDTLRADHLGAYGSTAGLTPNLDRFAAESILFEQAWAQANETRYSHASLFTSRYPSELDLLDGDFRIPESVPTLASVFQDAGWATAAFVAGGHLSRGFGLSGGFQDYEDAEDWGSLRDTGARALRWLDGHDGGPSFLFVHGYDTHDRYLKPPPFGYLHADPDYEGLASRLAREPGATSRVLSGAAISSMNAVSDYAGIDPRLGARPVDEIDPEALRLDATDVGELVGIYAGSVAWADASFGLLMAGLDARGLLERTTIVLLSDHGEDLGEHGSFNHRFGLSDETVQVPLMVRLPGGRKGGRRVAALIELVDVAPTLWEIAGLHPPAGVRGHSLAPLISGESEEGRAHAFSVGELRLLSVRGPSARLTASGISVDNPWAAPLIAASPIGGPSLELIGLPDQAEELRGALVDHLRGLGARARR